ncbi:MAG: O-6-methylguanine DNA methyltransferase [Myxococcota bacterium]|jgi:O-6-methylguanine DNA methyltransferase
MLKVTESPSPLGTITMVFSDRGLCRLALPSQLALRPVSDDFEPDEFVESEDERAVDVAAQIEAYLAGERQSFNVPLDLRGTQFQQSVWEALCATPFGTTKSYGELASEIGRPKAVRAVGAANGCNPVPIIVPCHRIIGANGKATGYFGGVSIKQKLLAIEGVTLL